MSRKYTLVLETDEEYNILEIAMDHMIEHLVDVASCDFHNDCIEDLVLSAAIRERIRHI